MVDQPENTRPEIQPTFSKLSTNLTEAGTESLEDIKGRQLAAQQKQQDKTKKNLKTTVDHYCGTLDLHDPAKKQSVAGSTENAVAAGPDNSSTKLESPSTQQSVETPSLAQDNHTAALYPESPPVGPRVVVPRFENTGNSYPKAHSRQHTEGDTHPSEKQPTKPAHDAPNNLAGESSHLKDLADSNIDGALRRRFKNDMQDFEQRAHQRGLSDKEIKDTYHEISRLMEDTGNHPLSHAERVVIAEQVMHQAANPTEISQGSHKTCNVATVECCTYTRHPSKAAQLVADVATTGTYKAQDGTVVTVNEKSLKPDDQSSLGNPPPDACRGHASQIFQVTAVNLHYVKENAANHTHLHYEQTKVPNQAFSLFALDSGERLYDGTHEVQKKNQDGTPKVDAKGKPVYDHSPSLGLNAIVDISNTIAGTSDTIALAPDSFATGKSVTKIKDAAAFRTELAHLQKDHKFPVIVYVDSRNQPFYADSGQGEAGGSGGPHVVTITDYDPVMNKVAVDNQWKAAADHLTLERMIRVDTMFKAMQPYEENQAASKKSKK